MLTVNVNGRAESCRQQKWLLPRGCIITVTFTLTVNILYRESSLKPKPDAQNQKPEERGRAILMGLYHHIKSHEFTYHKKRNQSFGLLVCTVEEILKVDIRWK